MLRADDTALHAFPAPAHDVGALYERYAPAVFALAYRRTNDRMQADDITAQTFVQALQAIDRYEDRGVPISVWLLRIAANQAAGQARRAWRELPAGDTPLWAGAADTAATDPATLAERWEQAATIHAYLAALSPDQRRALYLRYWEDCTVEEVALRLGRTVGATKQLLHRAILVLRTRMDTGAATVRTHDSERHMTR